jgi:transcriptional regulator with XRE-family HTH domain
MGVGGPQGGQLGQLATVLEGLQQAVEQTAHKSTPTVEAFKQNATALGLDPDLAEQVFHRLDLQVLKNVVRRELTQEKLVEALLYVVISPDENEAQRQRRRREWGELRSSLRKLAERLGISMSEVDEVVTDTGFGFKPDLNDIAHQITEWMQRAR